MGRSTSDAASTHYEHRRHGEVSNGPMSGKLLNTLVGGLNVEIHGFHGGRGNVPGGNVWNIHFRIGGVDVGGNRQR